MIGQKLVKIGEYYINPRFIVHARLNPDHPADIELVMSDGTKLKFDTWHDEYNKVKKLLPKR